MRAFALHLLTAILVNSQLGSSANTKQNQLKRIKDGWVEYSFLKPEPYQPFFPCVYDIFQYNKPDWLTD